jgi:hypothetical protein
MSKAPVKKVTAATAGGAAVVILTAILAAFGINLDPNLAASLATLAAFASGYLKSA